MTTIYCTVIGGSSGHLIIPIRTLRINIINYYLFKIQNSNHKIITVANLSFSGFSRISLFGCVTAEYGLFNTTNLIQNLIYIRFGINLTQYQFLETGYMSYILFNFWASKVSAYTSFHFFFTVPLKMNQVIVYLYWYHKDQFVRKLLQFRSNLTILVKESVY